MGRRLLAVLLAGVSAFGAGCSDKDEKAARPEDALRTIEFLPNDSTFAGFPGGGFSANLVFATDEEAPAPKIE